MSNTAQSSTGSEPPSLPPHVSIYTGPARTQLLSATLFTRLATTALSPGQLFSALGSPSSTGYTLQHDTVVLIFDGPSSTTSEGGEGRESEESAESVQDRHHEHFRAICLKLKDADIGVQYGRCVFDAGSAIAAGFQMEGLKSGDIMVVDLQHLEAEKEDGADEEGQELDSDYDSDDLAALGEVVGGSSLS